MLSLAFGPSPAVARPSSHTRPRPAPGAWKSEANPCCVCVLSWCGLTPGDQVAPPSFDHESFNVDASGSGPFCSVQCATRAVPSARTDGTSATLMIMPFPDATVRAVDQPAADCSANFSVGTESTRSIQLRIARSASTVSWGEELAAPAGEVTGLMVTAHGAS